MGQWDSGDDWLRRSLKACPNDVMRDIINDNRGPDIHSRASAGPAQKTNQTDTPTDRSGWVDPVPLRSPPGVDLIDQMVSAQDQRDLLQRAKEMAATKHARQMAEEKLAEAMGLSHADWSRMSEADLKARKEQQEKKLRDKGPKT
jgi:hypothetical protein